MTESAASWVLHVDLDQFIAAVEVLRRPELAGKPLIVGGHGDPGERAVVATASYEARAFGVGSGMPLRIATRKAPDAVILPVDAPVYTAASEEVMATLREQPGAVVQVLGWDEAFLGVRTEDPEAYAQRVRSAVLERTALHCSIGIGDTLVRAKNATDLGKPRGVFRLTAENWLEVMGERPTRDLWGIGSRISQRLAALGIRSVADLADADAPELAAAFGPKMGPWYRQLGRGEGSAVVDDTPWVARGHGRETTFPQDLTDPALLRQAAGELIERVLADVAEEQRPVVGVGLKVRYAPFMTRTFTHRVPATTDPAIVAAELMTLLERIEPGRPVRLLGVRAELRMPEDAREGHTPTRGGW
ncbi:DNA polymerase IV [Microbacterium caowuchunii]|uniref:DNA polymerase IV n=1 Tax=Microbacterium caowuchunii TaxID=2614638 RepID=UPI001782B808|nr:DNA polymerase IV [Microbacterium caowuchunii]